MWSRVTYIKVLSAVEFTCFEDRRHKTITENDTAKIILKSVNGINDFGSYLRDGRQESDALLFLSTPLLMSDTLFWATMSP